MFVCFRTDAIVDPKNFAIGTWNETFPSLVDRKLVVEELKEKVPDISKPPISVEDLKLLQEDDDALKTVSLEELEGMRGNIMKQLDEPDENKQISSPVEIVDLAKPDDGDVKSVLVVKAVDVKDIPLPPKETAPLPPKDTATVPSKEAPKIVKTAKVIKDADSIFGSTLSSIDALMLSEEAKKRKDKKKETKKDEVKKTDRKKEKDTKDGHKKEPSKSERKDKEKKEAHSKSSSKHKDLKHSDRDKHKSKDKNEERKVKEDKPEVVKTPVIPLITGEDAAKSTESEESATKPVYKRLADKFNPKPKVVNVEIDKQVTESIEKQIESEKPTLEFSRMLDPRMKPVPEPKTKPVILGSSPDPLNTILQHIRISTNVAQTPDSYLAPTFEKQFPTANFNQPSFIPPPPTQNQFVHFTPPPQQQQQHNQFPVAPNLFANAPQNRNNTFVNTFIVQHNNVSQNQFGPAINTNQNMNIFQQQQAKKSFNPYEPISAEPQKEEYDLSKMAPTDFYSPPHQRAGATAAQQRALPSGYDPRPRPFVRDRRVNEYGDKDERICVAQQSQVKRDDRDPRIRARERRESRKSIEAKEEHSRSRSRGRYESYTKRERSRSRGRDETFMSPLDSLYIADGSSKSATGKGYGMQKFKIPKIKREEKEENKKRESISPEKKEADKTEEVDNKKDVEPVKTEVKEETEKKQQEIVVAAAEDEKKEMVVEPPANLEEPPKIEAAEEKKPQEGEKASVSDHAMLGEFIANLIGNTNKKDLLLTLFNTLADSLSTQQKTKFLRIQQIADSDSSADESVSETKEKVEEEPKKEEDTQQPETVAPVKAPSPKSKKKCSKKAASKVATKPPTEETEATTVAEEDSDGVVESVGERIKSRKRNQQPPPKRKKFRTELDLLHEDIKDMFIRDGVLTASGKRMCNILKNGPPPTPTTTTDSETSSAKKPATRRRPLKKKVSPPKKPTTIEAEESEDIDEEEEEEEEQGEEETRITRNKVAMKLEKAKRNAKTSNPCVLLEKTDLNKLAKMVPPKKTPPRKSAIKRKADDTTATTTDSEADTSKNDRRLRRSASRQIKYTENESEEEAQSLSHTEVDEESAEAVVSKRKSRKLRNNWQKGFIRKKKAASTGKGDRSSERGSPAPPPEPDDSVQPPQEEGGVPTHRLDYYINMQPRMYCILCNFKGKAVVSHFRIAHPEEEVLISRVNPDMAAKCIKDAVQHNYEGVQEVDLWLDKSTKKKFDFECVFCDQEIMDCVSETFYDHLTTHTGEFRYCCTVCTYKTHHGRALHGHMWAAHRAGPSSTANIMPNRTAPPNYSIVFAYMCGECHYTQLQRSKLESHINRYHEGKATIYKVNMSKFELKKTETTPTEPEPLPEIKTESEEPAVETTFIKEEPVEEATTKDKETPLNVFIGKNDINEEMQKIEEERKKRMEEVNNELARVPRVSFIDNLKKMLDQQKVDSTVEEVIEQREHNIVDGETVAAATLPPAAKRPKLLTPLIKTDNQPKDLQAKTNTPIEGTIQRLQQILPPPMTDISELEPTKLEFQEEITFEERFTIKKTKEKVLYACLMPTCVMATDMANAFMQHCLHTHATVVINVKCFLCKEQETTYTTLEDIFGHVVTEHHHDVVKGTDLEELSKMEVCDIAQIKTSPSSQPLLRMRRLSGDQLSIKDVEKRSDEMMKEEEAVVVMDENSGFPFKITSVTTQVRIKVAKLVLNCAKTQTATTRFLVSLSNVFRQLNWVKFEIVVCNRSLGHVNRKNKWELY